jgi:hypothetical protein
MGNTVTTQFASSTCKTIYESENSSTVPYYAGGFSYGDIVISVFLFLTFSVATMIWFRLFFQKIRVKMIKRKQ